VGLIKDQLEDALARGARALVGGPGAIEGNFVPPTVLVDVTEDMKVMREETFGPVLPIVRVESVDEAIRRANASPYALSSAVFGRHEVRAIAARLRAGVTTINDVLVNMAIPSLPFGGVGDSGFGRVHGDEGLREMSRVKGTAEERIRLPFSLTSFSVPKNAYATMRGMVKTLFGGLAHASPAAFAQSAKHVDLHQVVRVVGPGRDHVVRDPQLRIPRRQPEPELRPIPHRQDHRHVPGSATIAA
jgi:delta 1-pyrroline-5-carboxylate dehydrogenase